MDASFRLQDISVLWPFQSSSRSRFCWIPSLPGSARGLPYQLSRVQVSELDLNELYLPSWISDLLATDLSTCQFIYSPKLIPLANLFLYLLPVLKRTLVVRSICENFIAMMEYIWNSWKSLFSKARRTRAKNSYIGSAELLLFGFHGTTEHMTIPSFL